jgi:hypothetical protein
MMREHAAGNIEAGREGVRQDRSGRYVAMRKM